MALPLNKILSSIIREFEKASLSTDLSREFLREEYQGHPILADTIPSRIRVAEASISMPLAFASIDESAPIAPEISKRQILTLILKDIDIESEKEGFALALLGGLQRIKKSKLTNKTLIDDIDKLGKTLDRKFRVSVLAKKKLEELQASQATQPTDSQESKFIFQTEELEKIPSDRIFRMDFKLIVD